MPRAPSRPRSLTECVTGLDHIGCGPIPRVPACWNPIYGAVAGVGRIGGETAFTRGSLPSSHKTSSGASAERKSFDRDADKGCSPYCCAISPQVVPGIASNVTSAIPFTRGRWTMAAVVAGSADSAMVCSGPRTRGQLRTACVGDMGVPVATVTGGREVVPDVGPACGVELGATEEHAMLQAASTTAPTSNQ